MGITFVDHERKIKPFCSDEVKYNHRSLDLSVAYQFDKGSVKKIKQRYELSTTVLTSLSSLQSIQSFLKYLLTINYYKPIINFWPETRPLINET